MTEPRTPRVLVLSYSQTGQVRRATEAFVIPFLDLGCHVEHRELRPVTPFPFPWTVARFMGALPETVLHRPAPIEPVEPAPGDWDLVVIAGQIWFLSPSQPITAFLQGPDRVLLEGRRVLTLVVCRNMWVRGWSQIVEMVTAAGGHVTDRLIVTHAGRVMASYFTTLFWALTGRRDALKALGTAEVADASYTRVTRLGRVAAERLLEERAADLPPTRSLLAGEETATLSGPHAFGEQLGGALYRPLARLVAAVSRPHSATRGVLAWGLLAIVLSLIFGLMIPCFSAWFLFGGPIRRWLETRSQMPAAPTAPLAR